MTETCYEEAIRVGVLGDCCSGAARFCATPTQTQSSASYSGCAQATASSEAAPLARDDACSSLAGVVTQRGDQAETPSSVLCPGPTRVLTAWVGRGVCKGRESLVGPSAGTPESKK